MINFKNRRVFILTSVRDYTFAPCIFDSEEDLLLYVTDYFSLVNHHMTMQELLDDDDFRVETGDYYKSASTIRDEKINDILGE